MINHIIAILVVLLASASSQCPEYNFDFNDKVAGPDGWGTLCAAYAKCGTGTSQTPINIVTSPGAGNLGVINSTVHLNFQDQQGIIFYNNGHTIEVADGTGLPASRSNTSPLNTVSGGPLPDSYQLLRFHFHSPSEHTINGKRYPLEMHMVTQDANSRIAVVGFLFEIGSKNWFLDNLDKVASQIPLVEGKVSNTTLKNVKFHLLVNDIQSYYTYNGSLTTPPCTEGLTWLVSTTVLKLTRFQLRRLKAEMPAHNFRPIQPLNGRQILAFDAKHSHGLTCPVGSSMCGDQCYRKNVQTCCDGKLKSGKNRAC